MGYVPPKLPEASQTSYGTAALSVLGQTSQQVSSLLLALIAAAVLSVSDYGLFMLSVVIVEFAIMLAHAGYFHFLINARCDDESALIGTMFWTILGIGCLSGGIIWALSGTLERCFDADGLAQMLQILAALQPFGALIAWVTACLIRAGKMRAYYGVLCLGNLASLSIGATLLILWESVVALLAYRVLRVALNTVLFLKVSPQTPSLKFDAGLFKEGWRYARGLYAARLADYLTNFGADFLLAFFFTTAESGLYRIANRLAVAATDVMTQPLRSFATRSLAEAGRCRNHLTPIFRDYLAAGIMLVGGLALGIVTFGETLVGTIFRSDYMPAILILQLLALRTVALWPSLLLEPLLAARHQTGVAMMHSLIWFLLSSAALLAAAPFGLWPLALMQSLVALALAASTFYVAGRFGGIELPSLTQNTTYAGLFLAIFGAALTITWHGIKTLNLPPLMQLGIGVFVALFLAFIGIWRAIRSGILKPDLFNSH